MNHSIILRRGRLAFSMDALFLFNEERQVGRDVEIRATSFTDRKIHKEAVRLKIIVGKISERIDVIATVSEQRKQINATADRSNRCREAISRLRTRR